MVNMPARGGTTGLEGGVAMSALQPSGAEMVTVNGKTTLYPLGLGAGSLGGGSTGLPVNPPVAPPVTVVPSSVIAPTNGSPKPATVINATAIADSASVTAVANGPGVLTNNNIMLYICGGIAVLIVIGVLVTRGK